MWNKNYPIFHLVLKPKLRISKAQILMYIKWYFIPRNFPEQSLSYYSSFEP